MLYPSEFASGGLRRYQVSRDTFITTRSSFSLDAEDTHLSYAEAWALTHFLTFGPGMKQGEELKVFFNLLQRGTDQQKAFEQAFGHIEVARYKVSSDKSYAGDLLSLGR